jgi:type III restriction enzyme
MRLAEQLDSVKQYVSFPAVPDYISDNLAYGLREYQKEAISRFLFYYGNYSGEKSPHLLWQMATGSGKTLIMAALILEMYKQGYRNFWFFVTSTDIITKTIDNFTNTSAKKHQFAQKIEIDGKQIEIRQVENFVNDNSETINIKFSTINILHQISQPELIKENSATLEDFSETPIVLIGDEAHHLNAATKKEQEDESTWENSVQLILKANPKNRLFEFTATANLTNTQIAAKYENKLLYNYDLRHFRNDKFSKDVFTFSTDGDTEKIMLRAVLISQYRKHIAAHNGISLKPVILFKSKLIAESKDNFEKFKQFISNLNAETLKNELKNISTGNDIWNKAIVYFSGKENDLCAELKLDFAIDTKKVLLHDGSNSRIADQPKLLATLEDNDNPVRAIFAVNMLQEGWDVLNLFDIVRLYDTRDGKADRKGNYVAGTGTVSEAQLIGRGARYFPFKHGDDDKYKRKFDNNENEPLRVIEQMHYHCKHNPRYISEIRQTLVESGIMAGDDLIEITLKMKRDFIDGKYRKFQDKNVYVNQIIEKGEIDFDNIEVVESEIKEQKITLSPDYTNDALVEIRLASGFSQTQSLLENNLEIIQTQETETVQRKLSEIVSVNIIRYAINSNKNFTFDKLKKAYPKLESMSQFMEKLGEKKIKVTANKQIKNLSPDDKLVICKEVLNNIDPKVKEEQKQIVVSKHFYPQNAGQRFGQEIIRKYSKTEKSETFDYDWYVYENGVLTSEEQSFVKWFADFVPTLEENSWSEIFLVRNEKAVKLYSWFTVNLGEGFEPDFVLFMKKNEIEYVFYIEPKGDWSYDNINKNFGKEQWKEDFLLEIENVVKTQQTKIKQTQNWRLIGLPFYNENNTKRKFAQEINEKIN